VSATPNRGGNIGLRELFFNVADQIRLGELIAADCLVAPRTFVIDVGVQDELRNVRCNGDDFDMHDVARVMDTVVARNRRTIWGAVSAPGCPALCLTFELTQLPRLLVLQHCPVSATIESQ
jgi:hypothetical protein